MFHDNLVKLLKELSIEDSSLVKRDEPTFTLELEGTEILFTNDPPGMHLSSNVAALPQENQEKICQKLLRANYLGQATKSAYLGLSDDEKSVIVQVHVPLVKGYKEFYDVVEDFVNVVSFWKKEALIG